VIRLFPNSNAYGDWLFSSKTKEKIIFTLFALLAWVFEGVFMAVALFLFAYLGIGWQRLGQPHDLWSLSIVLYICITWVVSVKLLVNTRYWNIIDALCTLILRFFYALAFVYNIIVNANSSYTVLKV